MLDLSCVPFMDAMAVEVSLKSALWFAGLCPKDFFLLTDVDEIPILLVKIIYKCNG